MPNDHVTTQIKVIPIPVSNAPKAIKALAQIADFVGYDSSCVGIGVYCLDENVVVQISSELENWLQFLKRRN